MPPLPNPSVPRGPSTEQLRTVLEAARRLLAARQDAMLTCVDWDALSNAVALCDERESHEKGG